jgi:xanthine dehydrogenase accessory factor
LKNEWEENMNDIIGILSEMKKRRDEMFVMATIIKVEGSAYRHEGGRMIISSEGTHYGLISGGCLEEDLTFQAEEVFKSSRPKLMTYDLSTEDDLTWGQGLGCNGKITVFLDLWGWDRTPPMHRKPVCPQIVGLLKSGKSVVSVKCIDREMFNRIHLYYSSTTILCGEIEQAIVEEIRREVEKFILQNKKVEIRTLDSLNSVFLFELYKPKEVLYIFGAGQDVEPLVRLASQHDFSVKVIDPRSSRCSHENFPAAESAIVATPKAFFDEHHIPKNSFVLIMTHNFKRDQEILHYFLKDPPIFVGILGPKHRTERLLQCSQLPDWIHSPSGISIHAEGPHEIAISIMAELIQYRNSMNITPM